MSAMWLSTTCRVCLASDREMYRLANTPLKETYERVTSKTLVVEGRPCCVCGVCLSALRRCRRFIDTAREANEELDKWVRDQPNMDTLKLTERPLFSFTRSLMKIFEISYQESGIQTSGIKQEKDTAENKDSEMINQQNKDTFNNEGNIPMERIKCEVTSDDDKDTTQMSDNIERHGSQALSNSNCINVYDDMIDIEIDTQTSYDIKKDTSDNNQVEIIPSTSNITNNQAPLDGNIFNERLGSRKRVKLSEDTESGHIITGKKQTVRRRGKTNPAASLNNIEKILYSCDKCSYECNHKGRFKQHLLTHSGEKPFSCDMCDYKCTQKGSLQKHFLTHTGEKPFSCDRCDYRCTQKCSLQNHLLTHTGERPFSCDKCDYTCKRKVHLQRHSMTHTGEKPYSCDKCDFKCTQRSYLKTHSLIHTGEKPYSCDKCDFKCSQRCNLKLHFLTHTGEKPFSCDKCDYKCGQKRQLKRHFRTHIGKKPNIHISGHDSSDA